MRGTRCNAVAPGRTKPRTSTRRRSWSTAARLYIWQAQSSPTAAKVGRKSRNRSTSNERVATDGSCAADCGDRRDDKLGGVSQDLAAPARRSVVGGQAETSGDRSGSQRDALQ